MCSAASFQVSDAADSGDRNLHFFRHAGNHVQRDRLYGRPAIAAVGGFPADVGAWRENVSRSTPISELIVLIRLTASAPPFSAASAMRVISVTLGVSFTITGVFAASFAHDVIISVYSGT